MRHIAVDISELASMMDWQQDSVRPFLNKETGELALIPQELLEEGSHDWDAGAGDEVDEEDEEASIAASILSDADCPWEAIPTVERHDSYKTMARFADAVKNEEVRNRLLRAIEGKGAFRQFRQCVADFDLEADWYAFKDEWLLSQATEWLEGLGLRAAAVTGS